MEYWGNTPFLSDTKMYPKCSKMLFYFVMKEMKFVAQFSQFTKMSLLSMALPKENDPQ